MFLFKIKLFSVTMSELEAFVFRAEKAEKEIEALTREIQNLKSGTGNEEDDKLPEDLVKLRTENSKLKYRLGILMRATEAQAKI